MTTPTAPAAKDTPTAAAPETTVVAEPAKPAAAEGAEPAKPAAPAKPEAPQPSEIKLAVPEGSYLDATVVERIAAESKARGLTQEQAQARLNEAHEAVATYAKGQQDELETEKKMWLDMLKADKEIGGVAFDENVTLAKRAVDAFGSDSFKKALNESGLGNHPELVRTFARIGRSIADDKFVRPGHTPAAKKTPEQVFYPDTPTKEA